jgi:hypothetical protein
VSVGHSSPCPGLNPILIFFILTLLGFELGFILSRQALYHLSHTSSLFCSGYLFIYLLLGMGLNAGLQACEAGALQLELHL